VRDGRIKALDKVPPPTSVPGLQPGIADKIKVIISVLRAAGDLPTAGKANKHWRLHRYKGGSSTWSIDVSGPTRLLFEYDKKAKAVSGMIYDGH